MMHSAYRAALAAMVLGMLGCGASEPPPPAVPLALATPDEPADEFGQLEILCNPPTTVLLDGKKIGTTPMKGYRVAPGSHDVTFVDEVGGNRTMTVSLGPGEGRAVVSDRPMSPTAAEPEGKPGKGGKK